VAGETRRQRRDARRAAGDQPAAAPVASQPATVGGEAQAMVAPERPGNFLRQSWGELRKVDWPTRPQVIQGTIVVVVACAIVGAFLWGADQALRPFVRDVLLGQ
jgi:preprotein translocase subunit SecE